MFLMKILFIADPSGTHTQKWLSILGEAEHQICLISYHKRYAGAIGNVSEIAHIGQIGCNPFLFVKDLLKIKEIIKSSAPDVLACHYALGSTGLLAALTGFHPQMITVLGGIDLYGHRSISKISYFLHNKLMAKFIFKTSDMIIVGCQDHRQHLIDDSVPEEKIAVMPGDVGLGVDLKIFNDRYDADRIKKEMGLTGRFVIFCPRRIVKYTNVDLLVKSILVLKDKIPDLALVLHTFIADEKYLDLIKELVRRSGLENKVIFTGERPYEEMPLLYRAADCTITISSFDGTPLSIAESMACGTPVIAYDLPSIREWIRDGENGILIKRLDPEEIAKAILGIRTNKKDVEKIVENAATFVEKNLDIEKNKKTLIDLFRKIKG